MVMSDPVPHDGSVTIVGASLSGLRCAETLRREGFVGSITLVGDEPHLPYDRPPLSKQVLSGSWPAERVALTHDDALREIGVSTLLGIRAVALDPERRSVELENGTELTGDAVVIATGASLRHLPGTEELEGVFGLRTLDDGIALRDALVGLDEQSRVVLIGAGFIGQEVATAASSAGHQVTVLEGLDLPLRPIVGETVARLLLDLHATSGVEIRTGIKVTGIEGPRDGARAGWVGIDGGEPIPADLIVVGIGVVPATGWLADSGLTIDNGVVTDERLMAAPGIAAVGDVARFRWVGSGHDDLVRIEHWQMAVDHGVYAARSLLAGSRDAPNFEAVPYFWSDQWGKKIQVLGHPGASDDVEIVMEPDEDGRFVALFHAGSFLSGVLAVSRPRQLMGFRALLAKGSTIDEALAVDL